MPHVPDKTTRPCAGGAAHPTAPLLHLHCTPTAPLLHLRRYDLIYPDNHPLGANGTTINLAASWPSSAFKNALTPLPEQGGAAAAGTGSSVNANANYSNQSSVDGTGAPVLDAAPVDPFAAADARQASSILNDLIYPDNHSREVARNTISNARTAMPAMPMARASEVATGNAAAAEDIESMYQLQAPDVGSAPEASVAARLSGVDYDTGELDGDTSSRCVPAPCPTYTRAFPASRPTTQAPPNPLPARGAKPWHRGAPGVGHGGVVAATPALCDSGGASHRSPPTTPAV